MGMTVEEFRKLNKESITGGALNSGSGFDTSYHPEETADQYTARLEAWKASHGQGSPATQGLAAAAPSGGADLPFSPITASGGSMGVGNAQSIPGPTIMGGMEPGGGFIEGGQVAGQLRALGQRRPPDMSMALAGLSRAY